MADIFGPVTPGQKAARIEACFAEAAAILQNANDDTLKFISPAYHEHVEALLEFEAITDTAARFAKLLAHEDNESATVADGAFDEISATISD